MITMIVYRCLLMNNILLYNYSYITMFILDSGIYAYMYCAPFTSFSPSYLPLPSFCLYYCVVALIGQEFVICGVFERTIYKRSLCKVLFDKVTLHCTDVQTTSERDR